MLRKKPTRKDNRYEYKLTLGRDIHDKPLRKSLVSARTGEAFVPSTYKQPFVDVNTYELTYASLVEGHLIPYFGAARLSDIRPADIQAYFATKTEWSESRRRMALHSQSAGIWHRDEPVKRAQSGSRKGIYDLL